MSFLFRFHKGMLADSMQTVVELHSKQELIDHIRNDRSWLSESDLSNLEVKYYTYDDRIDWECHVVYLESYGVIGWTNKQVEG